MKSYRVTRRDGASALITAASFLTDGAGARFIDADGGIVASFSDGEIASVLDSAITFDAPPAPPVTEPVSDGDDA